MLAGIADTQAQRWDIGGLLLDPNAPSALDMFNWSNTSGNFGSARAMAMGGAMTSLGGDLSSMAVNPAGLGMYRQNEVSITPLIGGMNSRTADADRFGKNSNTRFSIANFGVALKAYEGTGKVVAVNVGFGYNRLADFNYRTSFARKDVQSMIAPVFADQLNNTNFTSNDFYDSRDEFRWDYVNDPQYWGAVLGYKCGLIDDSFGTTDWHPDFYGRGFGIDQYTTLESRGSIGEYELSTGLNINNKVYVGFTLGIQSLYQRRDVSYSEEYTYDKGSTPADEMQLEGFNYDQTSIANGSGVNMKLGITYRPISALRIGVAVHTPTWYSVDYKYQGAMVSRVLDNKTGKYISPDPDGLTDVWVDSGRNSWNFRTPARLLLGASYTFGQRAIISVDYERSWYNTIRTGHTPVGDHVFKGYFRDFFKGSNTLRIGAEFKPVPILAIRAGYGVNGSMVRNSVSKGSNDSDYMLSSPVVYNTQYGSAGLGIMCSRYFFIDLAYQYVSQKYTVAKLYYAQDMSGAGENEYSGDYSIRHNRHNVAITLGFRF